MIPGSHHCSLLQRSCQPNVSKLLILVFSSTMLTKPFWISPERSRRIRRYSRHISWIYDALYPCIWE
ncbi:hypothetical protein NP493_8480g00000 [Ridgeia piscesae]|uniref:Uncharacterized protein n=1 Tax=Ridgeia piscesae TaxID=27915 RepID=A0AAD9IPR5_RIDPI|nr:hypothetical protein NP493_8480g00000 [Ridgeia piscesae]